MLVTGCAKTYYYYSQKHPTQIIIPKNTEYNFGSLVPITFGLLKKRDTVNVNQYIEFKDSNIYFVKNNYIHLNIDQRDYREDSLKILYKHTYDYYWQYFYLKPSFSGNLYLNFSGANAKNHEAQTFLGYLINFTYGSNGQKGYKGKDGKDCIVYLWRDSLYKTINCYVKYDNGLKNKFFSFISISKILIDTRGGNGGKGQDGKRGRNGKNSSNFDLRHGTNGGNGGDGGDGGNGGNIQVYIHPNAKDIKSKMETNAKGGIGGKGGNAGSGGIGTSIEPSGVNGIDGIAGMAGFSGFDGFVDIRVLEFKQDDIL